MNYSGLSAISRLGLSAKGLLVSAALFLQATSTPLLAGSANANVAQQLAQAALLRTQADVTYDGSYHALSYPGGDVPDTIGVCSDVVIRALRAIGVDLQVLVHEDMSANFSAYPNRWGLSRTDRNIDHRRVPNLETFFSRAAKGDVLAVQTGFRSLAFPADPRDPSAFEPGDLVSWRLPNGLPHIGIVSSNKTPDKKRFLIVHNIGRGPEEQDALLRFRMVGHYRFLPERSYADQRREIQ